MTRSKQLSCGSLLMCRRAASIVLTLAIILLAAVAATQSAHAQNFTTLATIGGNVAPGGLVRDAAGNLYGTTCCGGTGFGTVFKVDTTETMSVLYMFSGGADGRYPSGSLVLDAAGNIYGTTVGGGSSGFGTVFKLSPSLTETVPYSFTGGADGAGPGGLVSDAAGNFYGAAYSGGITVVTVCAAGCGTVFKVDTSGTEITLHSFTGQAGDGAGPSGHLVLDSVANIYGTTVASGRAGTIFKLDSAGTETVLYTPPSYTGEPTGGLAVDAAGNIYFTKSSGSHCTVCGGGVLKLNSSGGVTGLHGFAGPPDGFTPNDLVLDQAGNLFGTTRVGGTGRCTAGNNPPTTVGCGTIFEIDAAGNETVLYSFTGQADGESPAASLILDAAGNLYGTTSTTVFIFTPPVVPPPLPDYSLSTTAFAPATISPGASSTSTVNVTALNGFSGSVSFTCSVTPAPALAPTCSIKPGSTNPGTPATLAVNTTAAGGALISSHASVFFYGLWLPLIGLIATGVGLASDQEKRKRMLTTALASVLFAGVASQVACGGGSNGPPPHPVPGTPAGTYTVTVNGVDASGALKHSTSKMLMVR